VDDVVTVSEAEIGEAIAVLAREEGAVVEGAGAASLAALLSGKVPSLGGKRVVLPLTGGNIDAVVHARVVTEHQVRERVAA
jgi:threonine dehydratase